MRSDRSGRSLSRRFLSRRFLNRRFLNRRFLSRRFLSRRLTGHGVLVAVLVLTGLVLPVSVLVTASVEQGRLRESGQRVVIHVEYVDEPMGRSGGPARVLLGYPAADGWTEVWTGCMFSCPAPGGYLVGWFDRAHPARFVTRGGLYYRPIPTTAWWAMLVLACLTLATLLLPGPLRRLLGRRPFARLLPERLRGRTHPGG